MKTNIIRPVFFTTLVMVPSLLADSANEIEFKQARADREKALAVAAEPINRRYKDQLDKLFRRATQAAELDLAKAIQAELQAVGGTAAAVAAGGKVIPPTPVSTSGSLAVKNDLKKLFENTRWDATNEPNDAYLLFLRNGECKGTGFRIAGFKRYTLEAPDILRLYRPGKKGAKETFKQLRVDVSAMTATQDQAAGTEPGDLALKYVGPAPKK